MKAAVIGNPIKHSLSPHIHGFWLKKYGIDGEYLAQEIPNNKQDLNLFLKSLKANGFSGLNVTLPFKVEIFNLLDVVDNLAKKIGAVNTVFFNKEGKLTGTNTDAYGFIQSIKKQVPNVNLAQKTALVLGAGGASRAILYGLLEEKVKKIYLTNRTTDKALELKAIFGDKIEICDWKKKEELLKSVDLLVNTTSLGMIAKDELIIDLRNLPNSSIVVDIVYNPLETKLLKQAKAQGHITVDGLWMLLYQAVFGFELFFGKKPEVTEELRQICIKQFRS